MLQDFDIAGEYDPMLPDAECIRIMSEILSGLELGTFVIKVNHRQLLDGIFEVCGCPPEKFRTICSAVDKLDKVSVLTCRGCVHACVCKSIVQAYNTECTSQHLYTFTASTLTVTPTHLTSPSHLTCNHIHCLTLPHPITPPHPPLTYAKMSWNDVRQEMVKEKGLPEKVADRIGGYVQQHGGRDLLKRLQEDAELMSVAAAREGLDAMTLLFDYCEHFGVLDKVGRR